MERFKFNSRSRKSGEAVADYVAALKHLAIHCEFGDSLEDMLRDRLACGINDVTIQHRLLSEPDIDFHKALKIAQAMEMAKRDALDLQERQPDKAVPKTEEAVLKTSGGEGKPITNQNCYRCGLRHRGACRHIGTVCHACGKKGHLARVCRSKPKQQSAPNTKSVISEGDNDREEEEVYRMFPLRSEKFQPIWVTVKIDDHPIRMEVDTGATLSVISEATYQKVWQDKAVPPKSSKIKLRTYTGQEIPVGGWLEVTVEHNGNRKQLPLIITKGDGPSLLGRNWLAELRINWGSVYTIQEMDTLSSVLDRHKTVFRKELGTITGTKASLHINPQVQPSFHSPRPVPFSIRHKVEAELERLERERVSSDPESPRSGLLQ